MKSLKAVVPRKYTIFASNSVINARIAEADKVKDETTSYKKPMKKKS